jgi:outer membrane protein assembly factor BamB
VKSFYTLIPLLLLAACSSSPDPLEPPAALKPIVSPGLQVSHLWSKRVAGLGIDNPKLVPLIDGERVYIASGAGEVVAFAADSGQRLWHIDLGTSINAGPGEGDDLLLFGSDSGVIAIDKRDGSLRWESPASSEVLSIPQRSGNTIVVHSVDGNIIALNATSGKHLWQYQESVPGLSLRGCSEPLLLSGAVFAGTANGKVIALSMSDGRLLWENVVSEPRGHTELERMVDVDAPPVFADGVIYASSYQDNLVAIVANTGQLIWSRGIATVNPIALDSSNLYVSDLNGDVLALSRRNGGVMWKQTALHARKLSAPVEQGEYLLVGDYDGYLHWLAKEDGHIVARTRIEDWKAYWPVADPVDEFTAFYKEDRAVQAPPAVKGTQIFGLDRRGVLDVFRLSPTGK